MTNRVNSRTLLLGLLAAACTLPAGCPIESLLPGGKIDVAVGVQAKRVVTLLDRPAALAAADDGRVFFTERQTGLIRVIANNQLQDAPFAQVPVNTANDRGVLGIALHPAFAVNNRVYVFYCRSSTGENTDDATAIADLRVVYFVANGNVANGGEVFVASIPAEGDGIRVGGAIALANDNMLYVGVGDQGNEGAAADNTSLSGKLLRYTQDGGIPATNPTANSAVFARGFRNPTGIAVDGASANVFMLDENHNGLHEINLAKAGKNYGWSAIAGLADATANADYLAQNPDYTDPLLDAGKRAASFIGLAINPAGKYGPASNGRLIYGRSTDKVLSAATLNTTRDAITSTDIFAAGFTDTVVGVSFTSTGTAYVATSRAIYRFDAVP